MVKKILDWMEKIIMAILGVLMVTMVLVIFMQVVMRYGFKSATNWADEVARYCMIWTIFLACPVGYRRHCHIRIDVLIRYLPENIRKILELLMYILQIVFLGGVLRAGLAYIASIESQRSIALRINMQYIHMATIIGVTLMMVFILECICTDIVVPLWKKMGRGEAE